MATRPDPDPDPRADAYRRILDAPPTPRHVAELQRLGYTGPAPRTQAEASALVNERARRLAGQRASTP